MKTLLLIRHAKADKESPSVKDFDRPLAAQGRQAASQIAKKIKDSSLVPRRLISSSALRAKTTAQLMAKEWGYAEEEISLQPELYYSDITTFDEVIRNLDNKTDSVALFSHNPAISQLADTLTGSFVRHLPTCGALAIKIHTDSWPEFLKAPKEVLLFEYPGKEADSINL